jgi:hypothetical protein
MSRSSGGLQKNVRSIFEDAAIPDDIQVTPGAAEPATESAPVIEPPKLEEQPQTESTSVQEPSDSALEIPVGEPESESGQAAGDGSGFSDSMIEAQMKKQKCEKSFSCYKSGLEDLCKARVIHKGKTVQCLESKRKPCAYRISTFFKRLCQCPIRIRIAKKHGK